MFFGLMTFLLCQVTCRSIAPTIVAHPVGEIDGEESPCIKAISASTTEMPRSPTKGLSKAGSLHHHVKRTTKFAKSIYRAFHLRQRKPHSTSRKPLSSDRDDIPDEDKCCVCLERILHSPSTADRGRGRGMRWEGGDPIHRDCEEKLVALSSDRNPHPEPEEELSDSDDIPDEDKCCLCLERILHSPSTADRGRGRGIRWRCGHPIHRDCEEKLVATEFTTCPVCRIDLDGRRQDTTAPPAHIAVALEEGHHIPAISTGQNYGTSHFEQPRMGRSATLPTRPGIPSPPGRHQLTRSTTFPMVDGRPSRMTEELGSEVAYVGEDGRHDIIESHSPLAMGSASTRRDIVYSGTSTGTFYPAPLSTTRT
ncbi:hypothetical protein PCANC_28624 [Puccinia coronata f. sp. avenae]|uniref:RING-type domain-containing protein n=1 Tax=Puccinia coronata f. sp. avenae TaxID=200324 RepID=A0A2N5TF18_9BASI|nr:hypothetical protein PCANC_28624 [Puccinia coronata f. sp. avenae]